MRPILPLVVLVAVAVLLSTLALPPSSRVSAAPSDSAATPLITDASPLPSGALVRSLPSDRPVDLTLTLAYSHPVAFQRFLAGVQDPNSPLYHAYLTQSGFLALYAPTPGEIATVRAALVTAGGHDLQTAPNRLTVAAVLPAYAVDSMFGTRLVAYGPPGASVLYTSVGTPTVPAALSGLITGIGGLTNSPNAALSVEAHAGRVLPRPASGMPEYVVNGTSQWFVGTDFTGAYGATDLFPGGTVGPNATFPTGVAVATLLASSYNASTNSNLPPWDPHVIYQYYNDTFPNSSGLVWPKPHLTGVPVSVGGVTPPLPGSLGALNDTTAFEVENSLDLEMAGDLAPGAPIYNFYCAASLLMSTNTSQDIADDFAATLAAALSYNYAPARLGVVSGSFGLPDLNDSAWNADLQEAAALGVTVVMASGDQGNAPDSQTQRGSPWPVWPATAAFNTSGSISVGGVTIALNGQPTTSYNQSQLNVSYDSNFTGFQSMVTWFDTNGFTSAGSEGGISSAIPEPYWQVHSAAQTPVVAAAETQGVTKLGRAGPDVAFPGNSTVAYVYADSQAQIYFTILEGTSIAAPVFAGFLADEIAVSHDWLGFLAPQLYRIGSYYQANPGGSDPYYDVTSGRNAVFSAGPGWDATTGWGGLSAPLFLNALSNPTVLNYNYTGPTPTLPPPPSPTTPAVGLYIVVILAVVIAVVIVVIVLPRGRGVAPRAPRSGPPGSTYGVPPPPPQNIYGVPPPVHPKFGVQAPTFVCPYCGSPRPAEPVRCPRCGAL